MENPFNRKHLINGNSSSRTIMKNCQNKKSNMLSYHQSLSPFKEFRLKSHQKKSARLNYRHPTPSSIYYDISTYQSRLKPSGSTFIHQPNSFAPTQSSFMYTDGKSSKIDQPTKTRTYNSIFNTHDNVGNSFGQSKAMNQQQSGFHCSRYSQKSYSLEENKLIFNTTFSTIEENLQQQFSMASQQNDIKLLNHLQDSQDMQGEYYGMKSDSETNGMKIKKERSNNKGKKSKEMRYREKSSNKGKTSVRNNQYFPDSQRKNNNYCTGIVGRKCNPFDSDSEYLEASSTRGPLKLVQFLTDSETWDNY